MVFNGGWRKREFERDESGFLFKLLGIYLSVKIDLKLTLRNYIVTH